MKELFNVEFLYESDRWDGPLCGLMRYEDKFYYFDVLEWGGTYPMETDELVGTFGEVNEKVLFYDEDNKPWKYVDRTWKLYELEPWQLAYELYWHAVFSTNVKAYTDFDKSLVNERFVIKKNFYNLQKKEHKKIDYSKNNCIGFVSEKNITVK